MADDISRIEYQYDGDASGLERATQDAIKALTKYEGKVDALSTTAGDQTFSQFNQQLKNISNQVSTFANQMSAAFTALGSQQLSTGPFTSVQNSLTAIANIGQDASNSISTGFASATMEAQKFANDVTQQFAIFRSSVADTSQYIATAFDGALSAMSTGVEGKLNAMKASFQGASNSARPLLDTFGVIEAEFTVLGTSTEEMSSNLSGALSKVTTAARDVGQESVNTAKALLEEASAATKAVDSFSTLTTGKQKTKKSEAEVGAESKKTTQEIQKERFSVNDLKKAFSDFQSSIRGVPKSLNLIKTALTSLVAVKIGKFLANAITLSIDYIETLHLFDVAMGSAAEAGHEFVNAVQEIYGLDPENIMKATGLFSQLAYAIEMPTAAAQTLSIGLTKTAIDVSSLFNIPFEKVAEDFASGLQGITKAVRQYGMDIRTTTLQHEALLLGITESVSTMSEANRMGLRYIAMMKQASNASGDFAQTLEQPANQLRVLQNQLSQFGRAFGNLFIGLFGQVLPYINGVVMALRMLLEALGALLGFKTEGLSTAAGAIEEVGTSATGAAKQIRKLLAPFDELNILTEQQSKGDGLGWEMDPRIFEGMQQFETSLENIRMKALDVRDAILSFLGFSWDKEGKLTFDASQLETNLINKFPQWEQTIRAVFANWQSIIDGFKAVWKSLGVVIDTVRTKLNRFIATKVDPTLANFIGNLGDNLQRLAGWIERNADLLANLILILAGLKVLRTITGFLAPLIKGFIALGNVLSTVASGPVLGIIAAIGLITGALYLAYQESETFQNALSNFFQSFSAGITTVWDAMKASWAILWPALQALWEESGRPLFEAIGDLMGTILDTVAIVWKGFSDLFADVLLGLADSFATYGVPLIGEIGGLFSDVIGTVTTLLQDLQPIFESVFVFLGEVWNKYGKPTIDLILQAFTGIMDTLRLLWSEVAEPIFGFIGAGLQDLWENTLKPILDNVIGIITGVIDVIMGLWNNVLKPVVDWLIRTLGPSFTSIFNTIWNVISTVVNNIGNIIEGLLQTFRGIIDFLAGVFTGDWKRALSGLINVFVGFGNTIISVFELVVNGVTSLVNLFVSAIFNAVKAAVNFILGGIETIAGWLGISLDITWKGQPPAIPRLNIPRIPEVHLADGGFVTGPTTALIGEAGPEAVIPLDKDMGLFDPVVEVIEITNALLLELLAAFRQNGDRPIILDGKVITKAVVDQLRSNYRMTGRGELFV